MRLTEEPTDGLADQSAGRENLRTTGDIAEMKEYKYKSDTFELDDSKGCYIEVTYKGQKGYVGVNLGIGWTHRTAGSSTVVRLLPRGSSSATAPPAARSGTSSRSCAPIC